jgi:hypothetical protein
MTRHKRTPMRREALDVARKLGKAAQMIGRASQPPSRNWYQDDGETERSYHARRRDVIPAGDYPENQREYWNQMAKWARCVSLLAYRLHELAREAGTQIADEEKEATR